MRERRVLLISFDRSNLAEYFRQIDKERSAIHFEAGGPDPVRTDAHAATARLGIDDPYGLDSHFAIILRALLCVRVGVVGRENVNDEKWGLNEYIGLWPRTQNNQIGYAHSPLGDLNPLRCTANDSPLFLMPVEPGGEEPLNPGVFPLAHVTLPHLSIHILAVRTIAGGEIFFQRDVQKSSHDSNQVYLQGNSWRVIEQTGPHAEGL